MNNPVPVILDCDNTMGVPGCDIDDGLTILFLLGCRDIKLLGITCTYGNNSQDTVYRNTLRLLKEWGRDDIPVLKGAEDPGYRRSFMESGTLPTDNADRSSEAAAFLAEAAAGYAGELHIIATGSMTNLAGAAALDPEFFSNVRTISLMGGITGELIVGGMHMDELNLSCDPYASLRVLTEGRDVRIATAQNSLQSFFGRDEFGEYLRRHPGRISEMLERETAYWFDLYENEWNCPGFVNWDVMAAMQITDTGCFDMKRSSITHDIDSLCTGSLPGGGVPSEVILPEISDHGLYFRTVYDRFYDADISL